MQNDIYPRFLKSDHYQQMLRRGREVEEAGKGFFAKLQKRKLEIVKQDATGISPCLPQRYTKRQVLSISVALKIPLIVHRKFMVCVCSQFQCTLMACTNHKFPT